MNQSPPPVRRWPRRLAIGAAITAALLTGAYWYGGREATLQTVAQRVASASGGSIVITGARGSLYGSMHLDKLVFRSPEQVITAENIEIDWSPFQYFSKGIAINRLHVASLGLHTLRQGEPATMPATLAPPFALQVSDARVSKVTLTAASNPATTVIADVRFDLQGSKQQWQLRGASAVTPWGYAKADGSIGAGRPFKLDARASLTQLVVPKGQQAAQLNLRASGDLSTTEVAANGQSGKASGDALFTFAPFAPVPLRAMALNGKHLDPGFFNPALPAADLTVTIAARIGADRKIKGSANITNEGPAGTLDQQLLPLRAMHGDLSGDLSALRFAGLVIDFGAAGKFTGSGQLVRSPADQGLGVADLVLHTDRLDLRQIHGRMRATAIKGDLALASKGATQTLSAHLAEARIRLDAEATLEANLLQISHARIGAGASSIHLTGNASLAGAREFKLNARAVKFDPASFGDYPGADINADISAQGVLSPEWKVAAEFALRPSTLFKQALSGKGRFHADARHISAVNANLALGSNSAELRGAFGAPGEKLVWKLDARQLGAIRSDMYGTLAASGVVSGSMDAPRTSFEVEANTLGWVSAARKGNTSLLRANGEAWLGAGRTPEIKAHGTALRFDPAAFGPYLAGSINGQFDLAGRLGQDWRGTLDAALQPSTLANAPLWGHARVAADSKHVSNADVDLHLGPNIVAAKGSFGAGSDVLEWRIDAPQLASLGPNFGGVLRGAGTLSGTRAMPSLTATLDGQNLKLLGTHQLKALRASANLGAGRGAADPLVSDIAITSYSNGATRIDTARLLTSGTRGAHALKLTAKGEAFDAAGEVNGAWHGDTWNGTVAALRNQGRYGFALQSPVPLRLVAAPGAGVTGLAKPVAVSLRDAVFKLPDGTLSVQSLEKDGARWTSKGSAAGVPLNYLAQFSAPLRDSVSGDLTLGADWSLDLQSGGALAGGVHVFREKGDLIAGTEVPVALGLSLLDLRADVANGVLRTQAQLEGSRAGKARMEASAQMIGARLGTASPLKLAIDADMGSIAWLAPLTGEPGIELDGAMKVALTGAGTIGAPTLNGTVSGERLAVRWTEQGVNLRNGELRAQLAGDQLLLQQLSFEGRQGKASAQGTVRFADGEASMQLKLVADKLEILSRPDRTLVVSGESTLLRDAKHFSLDGKFRADRALIELAPQDRPVLSQDVIVLGRSKPGEATESTSIPLAVDIEADLGENFRLRGMGIDSELTGTVRLRASGGRAPRANGSIRVASGTYKAYGQNLTIERGVLTFSGAMDNPALNIRAVRKRPEGDQLSETNVEAGVEVRGTAQAPVAKLVSTPSVPDSEKLAWLVLGHGMEAVAGNEAGVLTAAAGALLGGSGGGFQSRLASTLGVDELGLSQGQGLESTVVTVGKRISSRAYLSFEQGATSASSLVKLRYKLNRRLTLQFQTGTNTALDILYSWAFD